MGGFSMFAVRGLFVRSTAVRVSQSLAGAGPQQVRHASSSFTFQEIVEPLPPRNWEEGAPSAEGLTGASQKLFAQLSSFEDPKEMAGLVQIMKNAKHLQREHVHLVMSRLAESRLFSESKEMKQVLTERDFSLDVNTYNYLLTSLFHQDSDTVGAQAVDLWREMEQRKISPDETTYSALVVGFARCKGDYSQQSFEALTSMRQAGFEPSLDLYRQVFVQLAEQDRVEQVESLLSLLKENNSHLDADIYNVLIKMYTNNEDVDRIQALLKEMDSQKVSKDSKTWSLLIEAFKSDTELAQNLVDDMKQHNVQFDRNILSALVGYEVSLNDPLKAEVFLNDMLDQDMVPLNFAYTSLLTHYAEKGDIRRAERIFHLMKEHNSELTADHYLALALGYVNRERFTDCDRILMEMERFPRSREMYHVVMRRIMYDGDKNIGQAEELITTMKDDGIPPNLETYSMLIDGYCVVEDMEAAYNVVELMKRDGIEPTAQTYISLITGFSLKNDLQGAAPLIQRFSAADTRDFLESHEKKQISSSASKE